MPEFTIEIDAQETVQSEAVLERLAELLAGDSVVLGPAAGLHGDAIGATFQVEAESLEEAARASADHFGKALVTAYFDVFGALPAGAAVEHVEDEPARIDKLLIERVREPVPA